MRNNRFEKLIEKWENRKISDADFLAEFILKFESKKEMLDMLYSLFTRTERRMLATRLLIVKKLKEGRSQHEVSSSLHVGVATVNRGALEIEKERFKFI
ncbi:MAG TPA: Trp family transcriptional regulator [Candidatus Paceibacterota bacterium]